MAQSFWSMAVLFCIAMGPAFITVVGQYMGAGAPESAVYYMKKLLRITYLGSFIWNFAFFLVTPLILMLYSLSEETVRLVILHNIFNALPCPLGYSFSNGLRAAGDVKFNMYVSIFSTAICWVLLSMAGAMGSGVILPRYALSFLPISGGKSLGRVLHMLSAYWGFVCMSLHLGCTFFDTAECYTGINPDGSTACNEELVGKIRYLGFSSHASVKNLTTFADHHAWDFAQIQMNYYDWMNADTAKEYQVLADRNIPVIVMEPCRGGKLASLCPEADTALKDAHPDWSIAS